MSGVLVLAALLAAAGGPTAEAERLAAKALGLAPQRPDAALAQARRALALTQDFEPTAFVQAGRKGEVVEDAYLAARLAYRRHRGRIYEAVGECLARSGKHAAAVRYLRRAVDLGRPEAVPRLARALIALGRGREGLDTLLASGAALGPEALAVAEAAADAAGVPSLQAEIDHVRLRALAVEPRVEPRAGPFRLPERARLSTGVPFRFDVPGLTLLYVSEPQCRSCSADLEALQRLAPAGARVVMMPALADQDDALRRALTLYRYHWPVVLGPRLAAALGIEPPGLVAVGRDGWSGAVLRPPLAGALPLVAEILGRADVRETLPRAAWNQRPVERQPPAPLPGLLPDGLAPGEDDPAPEAFTKATAAFRAGRPGEALRLFEFLEAEGDGWLLPPEARLDRALCLAALGRREEARHLLLRTGDSRFQDAVDRALEAAGTPPARRKQALAFPRLVE